MTTEALEACHMKLYSFEIAGRRSVGVEKNGKLIDVGDKVGGDILSLLRGGDAFLKKARDAAAASGARTYKFHEVKVLAPVPRPGKIVCANVNFHSHLQENPDARLPEQPFFFTKVSSAVIANGDPILHPGAGHQVDYEVELAAVIGKTLKRNTPEDQIMACIAGYTILNDVSARDVQKDQQVTVGKNFDTFAPMGPCLVTSDELVSPEDTKLMAMVNNKMMQDGTTRDWIFPLRKLIAALTHFMTLEPGDIVATGTPAGAGAYRKPAVYLKPGDTVTLEVQNIGQLENPIRNAA
jgi:2-keto-4-pentenoate hydratase/2-oxohepta-3-ene-1,7-dioic acid hydratase in catechol pathway